MIQPIEQIRLASLRMKPYLARFHRRTCWFRKGRDGREKVASTCAAFALRGVIGNANLPIDR